MHLNSWGRLILGKLMKTRGHHVQLRDSSGSQNQQARREIESFLLAVRSYPDRVAKEPGITFDQHLANVFAATLALRRRA